MQRNFISKAIAISFMISTFVLFAIASWFQNPKFENLFSYQGNDFPRNPLVASNTKGIGVHFFGDLLESTRIVSDSGSPYIEAGGTYLPFSYSVLRVFGSLNYKLLCVIFLISAALGILVVTQISHRLNREIRKSDFFIVLLSWPMLSAIDRGNLQIYITLMLVLAIVLVSTGHDLAAAIVIGLVGAMKGYPILFLLVFLGRSKATKSIMIGVLTCLLSSTAALLSFSGGFIPNLRGFVHNFTSSSRLGYFPTAYNNSLRGLFESLSHFDLFGLGNFFNSAINHPARISVPLILIASVACAMTSKLEHRVALVAIVLILAAPYSPSYVLGLLIAVVVSIYLVNDDSKAYAAFAVLLAILLSPKLIPLSDFGQAFDPFVPTLNSVLNPILLVAMFFSLVVFIVRKFPFSKLKADRSI